ncbi:MAG: hypothetical protein H7245_19095 [Candidatus Saccharibacteria bacterium]|nr:hypothetical protein [Pseudorhodobacter sp.]
MLTLRMSAMACLLLAACDGNPLAGGGGGAGSDGGDGGGTSNVPEEVARGMNAFSYVDGVLKIDMQGVTSSGKLATFRRMASLDVPSGSGNPGYQAYRYQDTALTRSYLAYVATNDRGSVLAVAGGDGGQFNEHNDGGRFVQLTAFSRPLTADAPESGLFSYAGSYVGIFAPGDYADGSDPRPPELRPVEPWVVRGTAQINGSFAQNTVEGGVTNRQLFDQDGNQITSVVIDDGDSGTADDPIDTTNLAGIVLRETTLESNGSFLGKVEFYGVPDNQIGDYGGTFGGISASDVAGVLWLHPIQGQDGIWEMGAFNLPRCDLAGASPLCVPR